MFSALTEVLQKTLTIMGTKLHTHSKCQIEQVNKLTEAVAQLTSLHNMPISWLQGALQTQKIQIIQILGKMMKRMIDRIGSLSMKWIVAFTMKPT